MGESKKEVKEIIHQLEMQGWSVRKGKHYVAYPKDKTKRIVIVSLTPSDLFAVSNIKKQLRKSGAVLA